MATSIYITSAEGHSGKSSIALGVLDTLIHEFTHHHLDNKLRPLLKHLQKSFGTKKALEIEEALIGDHSTALADFLWKNNVRIIDQP